MNIETVLTEVVLDAFADKLRQEEKSSLTIGKYIRDIRAFSGFLGGQPVSKERVIAFKQSLIEQGYAVASVNSMLAAVNALVEYLGLRDCRVRFLRVQKRIYCPEEKELTKAEYIRLLETSKSQRQLNLILRTICATGIRVSELQYFTLEAVKRGEVTVRCKNKSRSVYIPAELRALIMSFAKKNGIQSGAIFVGKSGKPLNRSCIWAQMKNLCQTAQVNPKKVFPHNLRKLFARTFYAIEKDIAKLADILGHGSIETTRIYIMSTGAEHRRKIEAMGLVYPNWT